MTKMSTRVLSMLKLMDIAETKIKEKPTQNDMEYCLSRLHDDYMYDSFKLSLEDDKYYLYFETDEHKKVTFNNDLSPKSKNKNAIVAEVNCSKLSIRFAKYNGKRITQYSSTSNEEFIEDWLCSNPEWSTTYIMPEIMNQSGYRDGFDTMFSGHSQIFIAYIIKKLELNADGFLNFIAENSYVTDDIYDVYDYEMTCEFGKGTKASYTVFAKNKNIKVRISRLKQALDTLINGYSDGWWHQLLYTGAILKDLDLQTLLLAVDSFDRHASELANAILYDEEIREHYKKVFNHIGRKAVNELVERVKEIDTPIPTSQLDMINNVFDANNIKKTKKPMVINHSTELKP